MATSTNSSSDHEPHAWIEAEIETWKAEARDWRLQHLISHSFVQSLMQSPAWKLLRPLRTVRQLLRPRGFGAHHLIPWHQLEPDREAEPGTWIATGPSPYFIVPCVLPSGWLRVHLRMTAETDGRLELCDIGGSGLGDFDSLKQLDVHSHVERDEYVYLRRTALGLRLHPLNTAGRFRLEDFRATPVPAITAAVAALPHKLAALRRYGLVRRALVNGLGLLLRGRLREFAGKLHDGLHWTRNTAAACVLPSESTSERKTQAGTQKLDIVYVLKDAGLCGGVRVILEHVARLRRRGHNVSIYYLTGGIDDFQLPVPAIRFENRTALQAALARFRGIKVATWYETAPWVAESLRPGDRGYYLVQDIEDCYGTTPEETQAALATYRLGLRPITEGVWVREQLKQRFGRESVLVGIGVDFDIFQPVSVSRQPYSILTTARTWSGGGAAGSRLKGWDTARATVARCFELQPRTTLATFSVEPRPQGPPLLPHAHWQMPSDRVLAKLYSQAGLYLLASTHEGFGLTAAEAMACGCPVVATYAQGNEEFCMDGHTALMAQAGDVERLAQHCLTLQSDPARAAELAHHARRFIQEYSWERVIDRLEREFLHSDRSRFSLPACSVPTPPKQSTESEYPDLRLSESATLDCTVIVPTINDVHLVVQCVASCRRYLPKTATVEIFVVDDGSRDREVLEDLQRASGDLGFQLLYNHQNLGFSATVNHGMRHAQGRYILLCNNDIAFFQPWLEAIERAFEADAEVGILGARLLYPNGSIQHAGVDKVPGQLRWHHVYGGWPGDHPRVRESRSVWSVTGALFAMRREVVRQLGGFSTAYTTAFEDLDYCLHAWSHGVRVGYCAELAAYHHEGKTRGATPEQKHARPLVWAERERAGGFYFDKKWAALRDVEDFEALLRRPRRSSSLDEHTLHTAERSPP
ncbi:MAG TPA: glycosyltransferase [Gemmataceae bacterium]|nr:glycosyltransferase [Gemmataceae bacterium]